MAKFEKTLSGDFETIAYNIENYLINDESIRLLDKVSMKNGSTNCSTMVFDIYNKYLENKIEAKEIEVSVGGGAVTVKVNGKKEIIDIAMKPEVVDPDDIEMLQDLVISAVNEALRKVDEMQQSQMSKVTGGMNIPGLF